MKDEHLEKNVEALRQGNTRAFDLIYERTNRAAYFTILYLVHDKMHAEDILQLHGMAVHDRPLARAQPPQKSRARSFHRL